MSLHDHSPVNLLVADDLVFNLRQNICNHQRGGGFPLQKNQNCEFWCLLCRNWSCHWIEKPWHSSDARHCNVCCRYTILFLFMSYVYLYYFNRIIFPMEINYSWSIWAGSTVIEPQEHTTRTRTICVSWEVHWSCKYDSILFLICTIMIMIPIVPYDEYTVCF